MESTKIYKIKVTTSNLPGAGTDAYVFIALIGKNGFTGFSILFNIKLRKKIL